MATSKNPIWKGHKGFSGNILKQIVFKVYGDTTVVTKYPDMSHVVPTASQLKGNSKFADAIKFAREIVNDPVKKAAYKADEGMTVYHTAIRDFMNQ